MMGPFVALPGAAVDGAAPAGRPEVRTPAASADGGGRPAGGFAALLEALGTAGAPGTNPDGAAPGGLPTAEPSPAPAGSGARSAGGLAAPLEASGVAALRDGFAPQRGDTAAASPTRSNTEEEAAPLQASTDEAGPAPQGLWAALEAGWLGPRPDLSGGRYPAADATPAASPAISAGAPMPLLPVSGSQAEVAPQPVAASATAADGLEERATGPAAVDASSMMVEAIAPDTDPPSETAPGQPTAAGRSVAPALGAAQAPVPLPLSGEAEPVRPPGVEAPEPTDMPPSPLVPEGPAALATPDGPDSDRTAVFPSGTEPVFSLPRTFRHPEWGSDVGERVIWMQRAQVKTAHIRLDPPQLGEIEVHITLREGGAEVWFSAPSATVREALETALPRLRDMFGQHGLQLGQTGVSSGGGEASRGDERPMGALPVLHPVDASAPVASGNVALPHRGLFEAYA